MSKEASHSQKSLKRKSIDPTHGKAQTFLQVPLAKLPSVVMEYFLVLHYWGLNTFCNPFVLFPGASITLDSTQS